MTVTDEHVAALRSFLVDDYQVWHEKIEGLLASENAENFGLLIHAAFTRAAYRAFSPSWSLADVIQFVGEVRSALGSIANNIDALAAEKLLRQSIGDDSVGPTEIADLDIQTVAALEGLLLQAMIRKFDLDEAGLEKFIENATFYARKWLAARTGHPTDAGPSVRRDADRGPSRDADGAWGAS